MRTQKWNSLMTNFLISKSKADAEVFDSSWYLKWNSQLTILIKSSSSTPMRQVWVAQPLDLHKHIHLSWFDLARFSTDHRATEERFMRWHQTCLLNCQQMAHVCITLNSILTKHFIRICLQFKIFIQMPPYPETPDSNKWVIPDLINLNLFTNQYRFEWLESYFPYKKKKQCAYFFNSFASVAHHERLEIHDNLINFNCPWCQQGFSRKPPWSLLVSCHMSS